MPFGINMTATHPYPYDGLVRYFRFDNNSNESIIGNNGVATNMAYQTSPAVINYSAQFVKASSAKIVTSGGVPNLLNQYSLSVWVRVVNVLDTNRTIINFGTDPNFFSLIVTGSGQIAGKAGGTDWNSLFELAANTWYHIVFIKNNAAGTNNMEIYVNGTLQFQITRSSNTLSGNLSWGCYNTSGDFFDGYLDEGGIWNRPLLKSEIDLIYNSGAGRYYQ